MHEGPSQEIIDYFASPTPRPRPPASLRMNRERLLYTFAAAGTVPAVLVVLLDSELLIVGLICAAIGPVPLLVAGWLLSRHDQKLLRWGLLTVGTVLTVTACTIRRQNRTVPSQRFVLAVDDGTRRRQFVLTVADSTVEVSAPTLREHGTAPMIVGSEQRNALVLLGRQPFPAQERRV